MARARILVADDHDSFRKSVVAELSRNPEIEIVGQASNGAEAIDLARKLRPDVALLDLRMPEVDGIAATSAILDLTPATAVLIVSLTHTRPYALKALASGASGFVAKEDAVECLEPAIAAAMHGEFYLSGAVRSGLRRTATPWASEPIAEEGLALFDREGSELYARALAMSGQEGIAHDAVLSSFRAYLMTRTSGDVVDNSPGWLRLSVAASLFGRCTGAPRPAGRGGATTGGWMRSIVSLVQRHPTGSDLSADWSGALPEWARKRVRRHIHTCASCHLSWAFAGMNAELVPPANQAHLREIRETLQSDARAPYQPDLVIALGQRQARVRRFAASEVRVLLGSQAASTWVREQGPSAAWLGNFLGSRVPIEGSR